MPERMYLYCLEFPNRKKYIGISKHPRRRLNQHVRDARGSLPVHAAIRKHGKPQLQILCLGSADYIAALEIKAIEYFQTDRHKLGYNVAIGGPVGFNGAPRRRGHKLSTEHRAKLSAAGKGRPKSPEHIAKMSAAQKGRTISAQHRAKIAATLKGKPGRPVSSEARAKISAANHGRERPDVSAKNRSLEMRAKVSAAATGRVPSPETCAKIAAAARGRPSYERTTEHRAKMSAALKTRNSTTFSAAELLAVLGDLAQPTNPAVES